ncbi:MAG: MFS transporter, partial [Anaerolineales bacterium]|nr:MFS transporter [Anaerolineales bacterium]
ISGLFVVRMLAPFLIGPIAGVVADRYNRKWILITSDIVRGVTVLGFLFVTRPEHIWLLYTLTAVQLGVSGFFFPTRNAILPDIVSEQELGAANALSSATWSVMLALGAALGGLVAGVWGNQVAFIIDALTFLVSAVIIAQVSYTTTVDPNLDKTVKAALRQYADGLRYVKKHSDILVISLHKGINALLVSSSFQVLQVTIAEQIFVIGEGGSISLGLMFAVAGVGTGVGPILARRFTGDRDRPLRMAIGIGYLISFVGLLIVSPLLNFPLVLVGTILRGVGGGIVWVFSTQLLLQLVPNTVRGRVFATEFMIFTLLSAAGAAAVGGAVDTGYTISTIVSTMSVLTVIPAVLWGLWMRRKPAGSTP